MSSNSCLDNRVVKVFALNLQGSGFETYARLTSPNKGETGLVLVEAIGRHICYELFNHAVEEISL